MNTQLKLVSTQDEVAELQEKLVMVNEQLDQSERRARFVEQELAATKNDLREQIVARQEELARSQKSMEELQAQASSALADRRMLAETRENKDQEILHWQNQHEELNQALRRKEKAYQQLRLSKGMGGGA